MNSENGNGPKFIFEGTTPDQEQDTLSLEEFAEVFAVSIAQLVRQADLEGVTFLENIATQGRYQIEEILQQTAHRKLMAARLAGN